MAALSQNQQQDEQQQMQVCLSRTSALAAIYISGLAGRGVVVPGQSLPHSSHRVFAACHSGSVPVRCASTLNRNYNLFLVHSLNRRKSCEKRRRSDRSRKKGRNR
jgi:hypothetical protein